MDTTPLPDGVYAASLTPQRDDLSIDIDAFVAHLQWLLGNGCDGLALFGTTGEANSFSVAERMAALEAVLDAGLPADRLLVGTGCCALSDSVALTRHAVAHGIGSVLMLPPFYYKNVSDDGVFAVFDRVIQQVGAADWQIYLYHFPAMTAVPFSHGLVARLRAAYPDVIAGMKDSSGDWRQMQRMIAAFPGFRVFAGTERYLLDILEAGGAGCITATANVTCPLAGAIFTHWRAEDMRPAQHQLTALRAAIEAYPAIPALKRILAEQTGRPAWRTLRPPLAALDEADAADLLESLRRLNFFGEYA
jgi:4-hydroxy-tetrahydrodipicolinate synthase